MTGSRPEDHHRSFAARALAVVRATRAGEVLTYAEVAAEAGTPGAARAVGTALRRQGAEVPWWRVVTADGRLVPGLEDEHARRLEGEGHRCAGGRVVGMRAR